MFLNLGKFNKMDKSSSLKVPPSKIEIPFDGINVTKNKIRKFANFAKDFLNNL